MKRLFIVLCFVFMSIYSYADVYKTVGFENYCLFEFDWGNFAFINNDRAASFYPISTEMDIGNSVTRKDYICLNGIHFTLVTTPERNIIVLLAGGITSILVDVTKDIPVDVQGSYVTLRDYLRVRWEDVSLFDNGEGR